MAHGKRTVAAAIAEVAARLGNTPAVCRKCYVHPSVVAAYMEGALPERLTEASVLRLL
jgi:DNA topoisomerase-1